MIRMSFLHEINLIVFLLTTWLTSTIMCQIYKQRNPHAHVLSEVVLWLMTAVFCAVTHTILVINALLELHDFLPFRINPVLAQMGLMVPLIIIAAGLLLIARANFRAAVVLLCLAQIPAIKIIIKLFN